MASQEKMNIWCSPKGNFFFHEWKREIDKGDREIVGWVKTWPVLLALGESHRRY